jgi:hypothetical protein
MWYDSSHMSPEKKKLKKNTMQLCATSRARNRTKLRPRLYWKKNVSTYVHRRAFALSRSHPFLSVANLAGLGKKDYYWSVPVRQGLDWSKADGTSCLVFYLPSV